MSTVDNSNGYMRVRDLVAVGVPVITVLSGAIYLFVSLSLSLAPVQRDIIAGREDLKEIRGQLVPRAEHDRDWASQDRQFSDMQRQLDQNRNDIHAIYSPNDALRSLAERLDKMEIEVHSHK